MYYPQLKLIMMNRLHICSTLFMNNDVALEFEQQQFVRCVITGLYRM